MTQTSVICKMTSLALTVACFYKLCDALSLPVWYQGHFGRDYGSWNETRTDIYMFDGGMFGGRHPPPKPTSCHPHVAEQYRVIQINVMSLGNGSLIMAGEIIYRSGTDIERSVRVI